MSQPITIAVIAGTARERRKSIHAAQYIAEYGRSLPGVEIIFVDVTEFNLPGDGNDPEGKDPRYTAIAERADAFFIVTPEYNHSYPGSLKRLLDSEYEHYEHKPVALAGVSDGGWGGVRVVEALLGALRGMLLTATTYSVYFPRVQNIFNLETGEMNDAYVDKYKKSVGYAYDELLWVARAFKAVREQ